MHRPCSQIVRDDGNCFFRAVGQQLDIDHAELRARTCDYIESHDDVFRPFVEDEEETLEQYVTRCAVPCPALPAFMALACGTVGPQRSRP